METIFKTTKEGKGGGVKEKNGGKGAAKGTGKDPVRVEVVAGGDVAGGGEVLETVVDVGKVVGESGKGAFRKSDIVRRSPPRVAPLPKQKSPPRKAAGAVKPPETALEDVVMSEGDIELWTMGAGAGAAGFLSAQRIQRTGSGSSIRSDRSDRSGVSAVSARSDGSMRGPAKRGRVETDGDEEGEDELTMIRKVGEDLRRFVLSEGNKVSKSASTFILDQAAKYEEILLRVLIQKERLDAALQVKMSSGDEGVPVQRPMAVPRVVGGQMPSGAGPQQRMVPEVKSYALIVKSNTERNAEEVKKEVIQKVGPALGDIRVKAVRRVREGVVIETVTQAEKEKLRACADFDRLGLTVGDPARVGPKILLFDVPRQLTEEALITELWRKNLKGKVNLSEVDFKKRSRIRTRLRGRERATDNVVLEVPGPAWKVIMGSERMYIGFGAHRAVEWEDVMRCFGCFGFGHMMRQCPERDQLLCRKCCRPGHKIVDCPSDDDTCRNCRLRNQDSNHSVMSRECPEFKRRCRVARERVNYD